MPAITLPLSFVNSFWSQDYRRGLETLFNKLEQGVAEDNEIINFIEARVIAEYDIATALSAPAAGGPIGKGFSGDDGASLLMAFWGLKQETRAQADGHKAIANDLRTLALEPFSAYAKGHEQRLRDAKANLLDIWLREYEQAIGEVNKLRSTYESKTRKADEAEDDAKFAPNNDLNDHYTQTSPRMNARNAVVNRTASVSERIMERLKDLRAPKPVDTEAANAAAGTIALPDPEKQDGDTTPTLTRQDVKGKGKAVETSSPQPLSPVDSTAPPLPPKAIAPPPILLAGIAMSPAAASALFRSAQSGMPLRAVRVPIMGEYPDCFTGEELVNWLRDNVEAFGGSLDLAAEAGRVIGEDLGLLRRIGSIGNEFEVSSEAFYQFRPNAFNLEQASQTGAPAALQPVAESLLKQSNNFADYVKKQIMANPNEPPHVRARLDAQEADHTYRMAVRRLDRQRLALEDRVEENLKLLQRWELERLRAVKDVLLKFHASLSNQTSVMQPSIERASTLIASYQPESDLNALIERYRTGPFRPKPQIYESVYHDGTDVVFGIDLRKWAGESGWAAVRVPEDEKKKDTVPEVLTALLGALNLGYKKLATDEERRRSWIYEIPLPITHHLREALNAQRLDQPIPVEFFEKVDAPTLAGVTKLWLLELDPPVGTWEGWEDFRKIYPTVGAKSDVSQEQHIEDVKGALSKLPKVHLYVLDAVIKHIKQLVDSTKSEEDTDVYLTKLAFALGRAILRPKQETQKSIQDRHQINLFLDLVKHYDAIVPPTIVKKKRESEKPIPMRKRTQLVDQRINRRSAAADPRQLLEARGAQIRAPSPSPPAVPPVPAVPTPRAAAPPAPAAARDDDLPPRPKFTTPPPEDDDRKTPVSAAPVQVSPPTPTPVATNTPSSPPKSDTPKSPITDDKALAASSASLHRSGSGETSRVRRPGGARGPRAAPGVTAATASPVHRHSGSFSSDGSKLRPKSPPSSTPTAAADPHEYVPKKKAGRISAGAFGSRPSGD